MASRIKRNPEELRDQLAQCAAAITALGPGWPSTAPSAASVTTAKTDLATAITDADAAEATWKVKNQTRGTKTTNGTTVAGNVLRAAISLYGEHGAELANFGFDPGTPLPPLAKLVALVVEDGLTSGSIRFDWENIAGASYEVQWFTDSALTQMVGSAASTQSEFMVSGLTPGTQYWMHVRPHRGGQTAPWSDPATRVAPV